MGHIVGQQLGRAAVLMFDELDARPRWARGRRGRVVWWIMRAVVDGLILGALYVLIAWGWGGW